MQQHTHDKQDNIAEPIRKIKRKKKNIKIFLIKLIKKFIYTHFNKCKFNANEIRIERILSRIDLNRFSF